MVNPGSDAAVIASRLTVSGGDNREEFPKLVALAVDCNATHVYLDPRAPRRRWLNALNLACSGATPIGTTDNLNFGNPHNPELFWQLKEAVRGLPRAASPLMHR